MAMEWKEYQKVVSQARDLGSSSDSDTSPIALSKLLFFPLFPLLQLVREVVDQVTHLTMWMEMCCFLYQDKNYLTFKRDIHFKH